MYNETEAILIIDMQEDYIGKKKGERYNSKELINNINKHIEEKSKNNALIIYIKNKRINKNGEYISELVKGLNIISNNIFVKENQSAFSNEELLMFLKDKNVKIIEIIGIDGCSCAAQSALEASKLGYKVVFPLKYIGIQNKERFIKIEKKLIENQIKIINQDM